MTDVSDRPHKQLHISYPIKLTRRVLPAIVDSFLRGCPRIRLRILLLGHHISLIGRNISITLHIHRLNSRSPLLIAQHLHRTRALLITDPTFLRKHRVGRPSSLGNLPVLNTLRPSHVIRVHLLSRRNGDYSVTLRTQLKVSSFVIHGTYTLTNRNFAILPVLCYRRRVTGNSLVQLLPR